MFTISVRNKKLSVNDVDNISYVLFALFRYLMIIRPAHNNKLPVRNVYEIFIFVYSLLTRDNCSVCNIQLNVRDV